MNDRRTSTVLDRVLDGHLRLDQLPPAELEDSPDALRYVLHARRFGGDVPADALRDQQRIRTWSTLLASRVVDPFDLAALEAWQETIDRAALQRLMPAGHA